MTLNRILGEGYQIGIWNRDKKKHDNGNDNFFVISNNITCYYYIDMSVLLENYPTHEIHKSYTCDLSGFFSILSHDFPDDITSVISLQNLYFILSMSFCLICNQLNIT